MSLNIGLLALFIVEVYRSPGALPGFDKLNLKDCDQCTSNFANEFHTYNFEISISMCHSKCSNNCRSFLFCKESKIWVGRKIDTNEAVKYLFAAGSVLE